MHTQTIEHAELRVLFVMELFSHLKAEQQQRIIDLIISLLSEE